MDGNSAAEPPASAGVRLLLALERLVNVKPEELRALLWSFSYYFAVMCSYYIIRPLRDEMGIAGGLEQLQWLFTGTFVAMLAAIPCFGWLVSRFPRERFLPFVYGFFMLNLLVFYLLFQATFSPVMVARAFFIWASVFNLFVVSVFWSFMADIFTDAQAKRLFGCIAAGGTAGAITGPLLTATLAVSLGTTPLLLLSAALLAWALVSIRQLCAWRRHTGSEKATAAEPPPAAMGGGIFAGLRLLARSPYLAGICLLMLLFTTLSTFLYFQQAQIIRDAFDDPARRTALFAGIDLTVNSLTLGIQLLLTGRLARWLGLGWTLALVPLALGFGFLILAAAPLLAVLVTVQVLRRAGNYAIMKPAREMLFVVLSQEEKYKAKNVIDTVVYRGGDVVNAWLYIGLQTLGLGLAGIALLSVPLAWAWALLALVLGRWQERLAAANRRDNPQV